MAVVIRLKMRGRKGLKCYRIVVADSRAPRDGSFVEDLGFYQPFWPDGDPKRFNMNRERVSYWLGVGAKFSDGLSKVVGRLAPDVLPAKIKSAA